MTLWLRFVWLLGTLSRRKVLLALLGVIMVAGGSWMIFEATEGGEVHLSQFIPWPQSSTAARPSTNYPESYRSQFNRAMEQDDDRYAFDEMMKKQVWAEGYTELIHEEHIEPEKRLDYWAIFRGTSETGSHVDANGKATSTLCLHLYSERVQRDAAGIIAPHPYFLGYLRWPEVLVKCDEDRRMKKNRFYFNPAPFQQPPYQPPAASGQ